MNPYGWHGAPGEDPWGDYNGGNLWAHYPAIANFVYPSGEPIFPGQTPAPSPVEVFVDDSSPNFTQSPDGCWTLVKNEADSTSYGTLRYWGAMHYTTAVAGESATCVARWTFPKENTQPGKYEVFVFIPYNHGRVIATYKIHHRDGDDIRQVDQQPVYNEWISLGTFNFIPQQEEYYIDGKQLLKRGA